MDDDFRITIDKHNVHFAFNILLGTTSKYLQTKLRFAFTSFFDVFDCDEGKLTDDEEIDNGGDDDIIVVLLRGTTKELTFNDDENSVVAGDNEDDDGQSEFDDNE